MKNWKLLLVGFFMASAGLVGATTIDKEASQVKWTGYGVGKSHWGHVNIKDASIDMKEGVPVSAKVVVDLNTIATKDLTGDMAGRLDGHLKNEDFFETSKYPTATFTTTSIKAQKDGSYKVEGNLNVKDKTHKESLIMKMSEKEKVKTLEGKLTFDRAKYNVKYNSAKFFSLANLGDKVIKDDVDLEIKLVVKQD